ncbi:putative bpi/lbp family protein at1g04970 [Phtheirospermum japonicum]|uniref:Putative bpi/lbp family protein at1g04970 n=1 Tax=Phtheirospermum japonicum TaxID=374723 RepID=A0A830CY47_9LAMI|nr:putative bpi/lbp family protein at1g04970 [Phtheirospermum japonicum]
MASSISPFLLLFLLTFCCGPVQSDEEGHITAEISNKGLDFLKNLLIEKAESSLVPLEVPTIAKTVKIPVLGKVQMVLSDIVIESIHATSSTVKTGDTGIIIDVSGATAKLSMNWKYSYSTWLIPISVSDKGNATVQVEGLEVGLSLSLKTVEGSLKLTLLECGCYVNNISIKLDGGASWLYQGLIDAFEGNIGSSVESAVSKKLKDAIVKLDSLLQSLPKEVPVTDIAALNVTLVNDPDYSESSLGLKIDGLISAKHEVAASNHYRRLLQASHSCEKADKMVKFSLHEDVLKSASSVYFVASKMHWMVDKASDQSLLNTAEWRFIVPQLYKMYPNHDMNLNLSVSSLPTIRVENQQIKAEIPLDVVVDVLDVDKVIPVVCVSTTIMSATLKTVIMPYINLKLSKGFQIPSFHGYELQDAQILGTDSWIVICSDVTAVNTVGSQLVAVH